MIDFKKLAEPFPAEDIEWRIAERGKKGEGQWAKVLAYVTNRAIMERLDDVCGPENWRNEFQQLPGAFLCGLSVRVNGEWITKWDGAQESQIEATKGGISGAMKRAAVQWGIGRYLYNLEGGWANIHEGGSHYAGKDDKKGLSPMKWDPPKLPAWALPTAVLREEAKTSCPHQDFIPIESVIKEMEGAFTVEELEAVCANRREMVKTHYNKREIDEVGAAKKRILAEMKG